MTHCKYVVNNSTFQARCFDLPLLRVLANLVFIAVYCTNTANCSTFNNNEQQELFGELFDPLVEEGRTFSVSNISLVITYVTFIVGLTMLAGFIWLAFSANGGSSHGSYGSNYNRRIFPDGISDWLFSGINLFRNAPDGDYYKRHKRSNNFEFRDQGIILLYLAKHLEFCI